MADMGHRAPRVTADNHTAHAFGHSLMHFHHQIDPSRAVKQGAQPFRLSLRPPVSA